MGVNIVFNEKFGRKIRMDEPKNMGVPTQDLIEQALKEGRTSDALELLDYLSNVEFKILQESILGVWLSDLIHHVLEKRGCEDLLPIFRIPVKTTWESMFNTGLRLQKQAHSAIVEGKNTESILLLESIRHIFVLINDLVVRWVQDIFTYLADQYGEEEVVNAMRISYDRIWIHRYEKWEELTPEEQLALSSEGMRAHYGGPARRGEFTVTEESDRYVMNFNPCGTGGIMRRGDPETGGEPWETTGVTKRPYDWSWQKSGVHYYCTHCTLYLEYFPAMTFGYPIRPLGHTLDPHAPCKWFIYKGKDKIRDEHYKVIGLEKT